MGAHARKFGIVIMAFREGRPHLRTRSTGLPTRSDSERLCTGLVMCNSRVGSDGRPLRLGSRSEEDNTREERVI